MTIYYCLPDRDVARGGHFVFYRHVDILNEAGLDAAVLHRRAGFRLDWFPNSTRVTSQEEVELDPAVDIAVMPETKGPEVLAWQPDVRKLVFNQGPYLTFRNYPLDVNGQTFAYLDRRVLGVLVVSEDGQRFLEYAFPGLRVHRVHVGFDQTLFRFQPLGAKRAQIMWMPRKGNEYAQQVLQLLKFRGSLDGVTLRPVDDATLPEVAAVMRESLIYLSFLLQEGSPLPPREAMASGCAVIGFHGLGGAEDFDPYDTWALPAGDVVAVARAVELVLDEWRTRPSQLADRLAHASRRITAKYTLAREREDLLRAWDALLTGSASRTASESVATTSAAPH